MAPRPLPAPWRTLRVQGSSCDPPWTVRPASTTVAADPSAVAIPFIPVRRPAGKSPFPRNAAGRRTPPVPGTENAARTWPAPKIMRATSAQAGSSDPAAVQGARRRSGTRWGGLAERLFVTGFPAGLGAGLEARGPCVTRANRCEVFHRPVPASRVGTGGAASWPHLGSGCHSELSTKLRGRLPDRHQDNKRCRR